MSFSPTSPQSSPDPRWQSLRIIGLAMVGAPVLLGIVLLFVLSGPERFALPPIWLPLAQVAAGLAIFALCEVALYRAPAISRGTDPEQVAQQAGTAYTSLLFQRLAICELLAMASVAAAFVLQPNTWLAYAPGGILAVLLLVVHVYPNARTIAKTRESLEREGVPVQLF